MGIRINTYLMRSQLRIAFAGIARTRHKAKKRKEVMRQPCFRFRGFLGLRGSHKLYLGFRVSGALFHPQKRGELTPRGGSLRGGGRGCSREIPDQDPPCTLNWGYMVPNSRYLGTNRG